MVIVELTHGQKMDIVFGGVFAMVVTVLSTMGFPFWDLIREDIFKDVVILTNDGDSCSVETNDYMPKIIENYDLQSCDKTTIKF